MTRCCNPACHHTVPAGWEGGYCVACCDAIEASEAERHAALQAVEPVPAGDRLTPTDPYAEYGFDHAWELGGEG